MSLGAGKETGKQENNIALTQWRWCCGALSRGLRVLQGMCCSLGGEGGGDAAPASPCLPLPAPEPSLQKLLWVCGII